MRAGQVVGVAGLNESRVGAAAQDVGREAAGDKLALAVLGRHEDHQAAAGSFPEAVEGGGEGFVVPVDGIVGLGVGRKRQEAAAGLLAGVDLVRHFQEGRHTLMYAAGDELGIWPRVPQSE